jgi:hypothetical protein
MLPCGIRAAPSGQQSVARSHSCARRLAFDTAAFVLYCFPKTIKIPARLQDRPLEALSGNCTISARLAHVLRRSGVRVLGDLRLFQFRNRFASCISTNCRSQSARQMWCTQMGSGPWATSMGAPRLNCFNTRLVAGALLLRLSNSLNAQSQANLAQCASTSPRQWRNC